MILDFGGSSPVTVLVISRTGVYCRISAALKSVVHDWESCSDDRSPDVSVQCIKQLSLISTHRRFLAGSSNSIFTFLLDIFLLNEKNTNMKFPRLFLILYLVISCYRFHSVLYLQYARTHRLPALIIIVSK